MKIFDTIHKVMNLPTTGILWLVGKFQKEPKKRKLVEYPMRQVESLSAVKPTKYKPEPVTETFAQKPAKKIQTARQEIKPVTKPVYLKISSGYRIPDNTWLFYIGDSRIDGSPIYRSYGTDEDNHRLAARFEVEELFQNDYAFHNP